MRKIIRREVIDTFDERLHKAAEEISPEEPRGYVFKPQPGGFASGRNPSRLSVTGSSALQM